MDFLITSIPLNIWIFGGFIVITSIIAYNIIKKPEKRENLFITWFLTCLFIIFVALSPYIPKSLVEVSYLIVIILYFIVAPAIVLFVSKRKYK